MKILCGTDFSEPARTAGRAAAQLAAKAHAALHLVHVAQLPGVRQGKTSGELEASGAEFERRRALLAAEAKALEALGAEVRPEMLDGVPDERLLQRAHEIGVDLIVIAPIGERRPSLWSLGGVAMRVIKGASMPTLVVREDATIANWLRGDRALRVLLGVDASPTTAAAMRWLDHWKAFGALDIAAGHVYARGERGNAAIDRYETDLANSLRQRLGKVAGREPRVRVLAGWGRAAEHLLELAALEAADLVVIGTHRRVGVDRLVHGSVSLDIVGSSARNVVTVPLAPPEAARRRLPSEIRRVLVPTDMSELSQRALAWACRLVPRGGTLQLLHVMTPYVPLSLDYGAYVPLPPPSPEEIARQTKEIEQRLRAQVAEEVKQRGIEVHIEVATAFHSVEQICNAAERLESDAICLSTHGRSGLSKLVLGSVAEGVIRHSTVPVFVIPPHVK